MKLYEILPLALLALSATALFCCADGPTTAPASTDTPPTTSPAPQRYVFLGDSITDGNTYPQLVAQTLTHAGQKNTLYFNAGIGGDTSTGMLKRLDRDVFRHKPTLVTLSTGINDKLPLEEYRKNITAIVDAIQAHGAEPVLLTTSIVKDKSPEVQTKLDGYNNFIRELAKTRKLRYAEVYKPMDLVPDGPNTLLVGDGVHPNYLGQSYIARAVLDALGFAHEPLPEKLKLQPFPGIIPVWHLRKSPNHEPGLTSKIAGDLTLANCPAVLHLPEKSTGDTTEWNEQERMCGVALDLEKVAGKSDLYYGVANLKSPKAKSALLNTGAGLRVVFLNGKQVYKFTEWTGWHAFKEQIPIELQAGDNKIVIEAAGNFFLSITDPDTVQSALAPE